MEFKNADPTTAEIDVKIDLASVKTDSPKLDEHLKSPDFFDVAKFPEAKFVSSQVAKNADGTYVVSGELTLRGVTKEISIPAKIELADASVSMTAAFEINRKDFQIVYPGMPDNLIKDMVTIKLLTKASLK